MRRKRWLLFTLGLLIASIFFVQSRVEIHNTFSAAPVQIYTNPKLTVVTYNIRGCRNDSGDADAQVIAKELAALNADIIALQEVDEGLPRSGYVDQAKVIAEYLQMNYVYTPTLNFFVGTYGNALLSRHPILSYEHVKLPSGMETRGLLEAVVSVNGQPLSVYTTHLGLARKEREEQVIYLHEYVKHKPLGTAILLGDLNTKQDDPLLFPIRTLFADPIYEQRQNVITIDSERTHTSFQIDYILLSKDITFHRYDTPASGRSDHYPLVFTVSLPLPL